MPSATMSHRRRRQEDSDDEQDSPGDATVSSSASSSKRARLNLNGDAASTSQPSSSNYGNYGNGLSQFSQSESLRAKSSRRKHQPGSIVRVKLTNFVTYTAVEFCPGPSLNMIIGPNGTGKSTLVCAICLGLGWGAQHLGRAKELGEFVKHGCQEATIEIELAGDLQYPRVVIRCRITREGNKSAFYFNGSPSSKKEILKVARHFSIQIDNLCQFLPQDKVVEFAAMTPIELLRSTQRAVAPQEMLDMHDQLKELRREQKMVEAENTSNQDTLSSLENRQRMQQADVDRMRERNEIQERIRNLEKSRPIWQYRDVRKEMNAAKEKNKTAEAELKALKDEVEPALRAVNAKQAYQARIEQVVKERKQAATKAEKDADALDKKMRDLHERTIELDNERSAESNGGRQSRQEVARLEGNIARLKKQIEEPPPDLDISSYNEKIRECSRTIDEYSGQGKDIQRKQTDLTRRGRERNDQVQQAQRDLQNLESQAGQQSRKLANLSRDTSKAWSWIQQNQDKFEKPIFGPPMVECSIKSPQWVNQIEALFQKNNFLTFTVQTKGDYELFGKYLHKDMRLSEINARVVPYGLDEFRPPVPDHELQRYGLDSWALDHISGPEPVLAMLCGELKVHATALADRDTTPQQYDMINNSPIDSWVTSKSGYKIIRRREYGPGATTAQVRGIRNATVWTDQPVDVGAKRDLQDNIQGWKEEIAAFEQQNREMQIQLTAIRERISDTKKQQVDMTKEKAEKQKILGEIKALPTRLAQQEEKWEAARKSLDGIKERVSAIDEKHDAIILQRGQVALDYFAAVETLRTAHSDLHTAALMNIEATSDIATLIARNSSVKTLLEAKRAEVANYSRVVATLKTKAHEALEFVKELVAESKVDPAYDAFMATLPTGATGQEMEDEVSAEKARLELTHEGNGGVIKEYEQRQKRVDALKATLEEGKAAFEESAEKIKTFRERWEPELDKLIEKISQSFGYNMGQINCAGEVGVFKDEGDFDAWAIQILVKFRENEPLTQLDSHRQSGGERAVSTIFYLMSLQSLTRSPFRVVDEINQGMDPRNERLVHKRMVDIACGNDSSPSANVDADSEDEDEGESERGGGSQYFLITPKLLNGLEYARGMRVLCIASGEKMPTEKSGIDFGRCVDIARGLRGLGGIGARANGVAAAG